MLDTTLPFKQAVSESKKGLACPCCGRYAKVYKRPLMATQARFLIWMYKKSGPGCPWIHPDHHKDDITRILGRIGQSEHSKLKYWGLLEERPKEDKDEDKKSTGYWRITEKGKQFVRREIKVPAKAVVLFGDQIGFDGDQVDIVNALDTKFSYNDLMNE